MVKSRPELLIDRLAQLAESHDKNQYYRVRSQGGPHGDPVETAARLIYLNRTCYNGLWRVNRRGEFNVPIGSYRNPAILDAGNLRACSAALRSATIACRSYLRITPKPGDFVYADPPYDMAFSSYAAEAFGEDDQERLRDQALKWHQAEALVMLSNADTSLIRRLYRFDGSPFSLHRVSAPRAISRDPAGRGKVAELVIRNWS